MNMNKLMPFCGTERTQIYGIKRVRRTNHQGSYSNLTLIKHKRAKHKVSELRLENKSFILNCSQFWFHIVKLNATICFNKSK